MTAREREESEKGVGGEEVSKILYSSPRRMSPYIKHIEANAPPCIEGGEKGEVEGAAEGEEGEEGQEARGGDGDGWVFESLSLSLGLN
jgi:hypothetical protein